MIRADTRANTLYSSLNASVFFKNRVSFPKFIKTSNDDISTSTLTWILNLG